MLRRPGLPVEQTNRGFTLIELLALAVIIAGLAGMIVGIAGHSKRKMDVSRVQADTAAMSLALESYKIDFGRYPTSTPWRVSSSGVIEMSNSIALYGALSGSNGNSYLRFRPDQTKSNMVFGAFTNTTPYVVDPWGSPYNYICTAPVVPMSNSGSFSYYGWVKVTTNTLPMAVTSGQVNVVSFDLWSYGPDRVTPVPYPGNNTGWPWNGMTDPAKCFKFSADDIVNWR
ncbi:MAG: hypothetical protein PCFJNLEI_02127 [Verrucomicrobiae bacterium]|nr:hypothetical protein [Verrucomicrobiae bacterium]